MKIIIINDKKQFRLIPDSALLLRNRPFFCPDYIQALHAKIVWVVKINRLGKYIQEKFAANYYDEIGLAIHFYDKYSLDSLISQGFSWERATCFDGSFALSKFVKTTEIKEPPKVAFLKNNNTEQTFEIKAIQQKTFSVISELSTYMTLKTGDYLALELGEAESAPLAINDVLRVSLNNREMVSVAVK